jgi:hypothetical protein
VKFQDLSLKGSSHAQQNKIHAENNAKQATQIVYQAFDNMEHVSKQKEHADSKMNSLCNAMKQTDFFIDPIMPAPESEVASFMPSAQTLGLAGAGAVGGAVAAREFTFRKIHHQVQQSSKFQVKELGEQVKRGELSGSSARKEIQSIERGMEKRIESRAAQEVPKVMAKGALIGTGATIALKVAGKVAGFVSNIFDTNEAH